jgi:hypothetical protein
MLISLVSDKMSATTTELPDLQNHLSATNGN